MKTALLVVSFGVAHPDTFQKTIAATEETIAKAFPQYPIYRAFVSEIMRARLKKYHDMAIDNVEEALARIAADGFTHVLLQPTLLIPGEEFARLQASVEKCRGNLQVMIGQPLLWEDADLDEVISILEQAYPTDTETVLLLMGHGTAHSRIYEQMAGKMRMRTGSVMRLCTIESAPTFADAIEELTKLPQRKVVAAPLLFSAGGHAGKSMNGALRAMLEAHGFSVTCRMQGLGELAAIQQMYVKKARTAAEE